MGHYSNLYDQEYEKGGSEKEIKKKRKKKTIMVTVKVPTGSMIIPPGQELEWAKQIIKENKKK